MIRVDKDWLLIFIIGAFLIALASIIDLALKEKEVRKIHDWMYRFSIKLASAPLHYWQVVVAKFLLKLLYFFGLRNKEYVINSPLVKDFDDFIDNDSVKIKKISVFWTLFFGLLILWPTIIFFLKNKWALAILGVPVMISTLFFLFLIYLEIFHNFVDEYVDRVFRLSFWSSFISCMLSMIAIVFSVNMIPNSGESFWFGVNDSSLTTYPQHPFLLSLINFPFDFLTLSFTYLFLSKAVSRNKYFVLAAAADLFTSLILTIILYSYLKIIDSTYNYHQIIDAFINSYNWLKELIILLIQYLSSGISFDARKVKDFGLLPVLLTTLFPVTLYVSIIFILGSLKPFFILAGRVFSAVSEKKESVFRQFAAVLAVLFALAKAIFDYATYKS